MIQELIYKFANKSQPSMGEGQRIQQFGRSFTGYMGTAALATAALPIPIKSLH
jgi:hypothetical protein